jgi:SEC-C motif
MLLDLMGTTPPEISPLVTKFCATLSDAAPEYVVVRPEGKAGYCHPNVKKKVDEEGGEIVYGRMIWLGKAMIEAEWHAVWQKDGCLVDVTAKPDGEGRILFVRTNEAWDGKAVFPNIRKLLTNDPRVHQLIAMQESLERNATRKDDGRLQFDLAPTIRTFTNMPARKLRRNDPCPCGSGKKFKKCCIERNSLVISSGAMKGDAR